MDPWLIAVLGLVAFNFGFDRLLDILAIAVQKWHDASEERQKKTQQWDPRGPT